MVVPALIAIVGALAGGIGCARWLPRLADDRAGRGAFAVACGLVGAAVALIGVDVYTTVRAIDNAAVLGGVGDHKADLLAAGLINALQGSGPIIGLAAAVYLLGPAHADRRSARAAET